MKERDGHRLGRNQQERGTAGDVEAIGRAVGVPPRRLGCNCQEGGQRGCGSCETGGGRSTVSAGVYSTGKRQRRGGGGSLMGGGTLSVRETGGAGMWRLQEGGLRRFLHETC